MKISPNTTKVKILWANFYTLSKNTKEKKPLDAYYMKMNIYFKQEMINYLKRMM